MIIIILINNLILKGGPDSDFEYSTQSYTGYEPTSMRAIQARYNPYIQARNRIDQLKQLGKNLIQFQLLILVFINCSFFLILKIGHSVDKVEYIIMGGTFMCLSEEYRKDFIKVNIKMLSFKFDSKNILFNLFEI